MATPLLPDQLDIFVDNTIKSYDRGAWVDISLTYTEYPTASYFMSKAHPGGTQFSWVVQVSNTGTYQRTELFAADVTAVKKLDKQCTVPWTLQTVNFKYDNREEPFQGNDMTKIVDAIEMRRHSAFNDFYEGLEADLWNSPASTTDSPRPLNGIPYYVVKTGAGATFGINGTTPTGHTLVANLSPSTYATWRNGNATYTSITDDDALQKLAEAMEKCRFKAPHSFSQLDAPAERWKLFTTYDFFATCERLTKAQNDNVGNDLGRYRGMVLFKGVPIVWLESLSNSNSAAVDTSNPVYGLDMSTWDMQYVSSINQRWNKPIVSPGQHAVREVHMDNSCQLACKNRRRNFVLYSG